MNLNRVVFYLALIVAAIAFILGDYTACYWALGSALIQVPFLLKD